MLNDPLAQVHLNFSEDSLTALNLALAFIMFGVALDLKWTDFRLLRKQPKLVFTGVVSQFVMLPIITFLLILVIKPLPSIALGMILVGSCPGGNVSNFFSGLGRGNLALSVALTAFATLAAAFFTPANFEFWAKLMPETQSLLRSFDLGFADIFKTVLTLLILPLIVGVSFAKYLPELTAKVKKVVKPLSFLILMAIIALAFVKNYDHFLAYFQYVVYLVFIHNGLALFGGYSFAKLLKLDHANATTISIETGIQNSGLALVIIFTFFEGNGGMSIIAAWWGIWHIISGASAALLFRWISKRAQYIET